MTAFTVRYFDPSRAMVVQENMTAASASTLRETLSRTGSVVLELRSVRPPALRGLKSNTTPDISSWCRELATLLRAGMTVVEALETLEAQAHSDVREVHAKLLRSLRQGQSLSRAMATAGNFPPVLVASVTASERSSTLIDALQDFLRYDEMIKALRGKIISASIYPGIVVTLGALIALFLLLFVIPRFSRMYIDFHGTLSLPTQILMTVSGTVHEHLMWVLAALCMLGGLVAWAWFSGYIHATALKTIEAVRPLRKRWEHFGRAKLYQSLALMFRGGYTLDEALGVCEGMNLGQSVTQGIPLTRAQLARGRSVVASFVAGGLADTVAERLLAVGERSGSFDTVLQAIADRHAERFTTIVERTTRFVEPLLLLIVALVVGGIVVMMYMPIFDIANGVR